MLFKESDPATGIQPILNQESRLNITWDDGAGIYMCNVRNEYGEEESRVKVTIEEPPPLQKDSNNVVLGLSCGLGLLAVALFAISIYFYHR